MADKLTQSILDALAKAAADPGGLPLYAGKADPGLFPSAAAAKPAAQKALADGLLKVVRTEPKGKAVRELYGPTEAGWEFLLAQVNPKQVLEDFVRAVEAREGEVGELLAVARRMADSLHGLKDAVSRVLPKVAAYRLPHPPEPEPAVPASHRLTDHPNGTHAMNGVATLAARPAVAVQADPRDELAGAILARLADWAASASVMQDCPLPELFRSLTTREPAPTIGEFHDCLRALVTAGRIYLHPWTAPLYAMPEPPYALLFGHNVAYFASPR